MNNVSISEKFKEPISNTVPPASNRTTADYFNYGSNYDQVHIHEGEFLHNRGFRGQNMQISVLDAGFLQYKSVTAFDSMRMNNQMLSEKDFVAFDNSVVEDDSHGMYCLSTMAANWPGRMVGTSPKASYYLIRTENVSSEYPIEEFNWVVGAEFADSTGSDMISSSLGYSDFDDATFNHTYNDFYRNSTTVTKGASFASKKGMIVMNSAGNSGQQSWKYLNFPADADSVCTVGAINSAGQIAAFSSYGYPGKIKPNIVSIGLNTVIAGYNNQPSSGSGTSFSNPNVAGLIACLWQAFPAFNNMKILDAVYKSADRYTAPTNQYGYGVPNFKVAYRSLKKQENISRYGSDWMWATPDPFTNKIDVTLIGRVDGKAVIELLNSANVRVAIKNITTEIEEIYSLSFLNLDSLPGGKYFVRYSDSVTTKTVTVQKESLNNSSILAMPNPFKNTLTTSFTALESGKITLRLLDAKGRKVAEVSKVVANGQKLQIVFETTTLQKGAYILQYIGAKKYAGVKVIKM